MLSITPPIIRRRLLRGALATSAGIAALAASSGAASGAAVPAPPPTTPLPPVVSTTIHITDSSLGPVSFSALAAGDPKLAKTGRLVLFLHGFPESPETWRAILPVIAAKGYYAVAPTMRGYAGAAQPTDVSDYSIEHLAEDVVREAAALGANRFHLVGHDWGAGVGWGVAIKLPQYVESFTSLATPAPDAMTDALNDPFSGQQLAFAYMAVLKQQGIQNVLLALGWPFFSQALQVMGAPKSYADAYAYASRNPSDLNLELNYYRANPIPVATPVGPDTVPTTYVWDDGDFAFTKTAALDTAKHVTGPYRFITVHTNHFVAENATADVEAAVLAQIQAVKSSN